MAEIKRLTALKTSIKPVISGRFVKQEGFNPSFVVSPSGQRLSRVRILATVVDKYESEKFTSITLDDGTATIRVKVFGSTLLGRIGEADIVDVIGRVKEYSREIYILAEAALVTEDPNREILRALEIRKHMDTWNAKKSRILELQNQASDVIELKALVASEGMDPDDVEPVMLSQEITEEEPKEDANTEAKSKILGLVESLDSGKGADYTELIKASDLAEDVLDSIINDLLNDGLCFEPKPGKIKKL